MRQQMANRLAAFRLDAFNVERAVDFQKVLRTMLMRCSAPCFAMASSAISARGNMASSCTASKEHRSRPSSSVCSDPQNALASNIECHPPILFIGNKVRAAARRRRSLDSDLIVQAQMNPRCRQICAALQPRSRPTVVRGRNTGVFPCPVICDFAFPLSSFSQVSQHRLHIRMHFRTFSISIPLPSKPQHPLPQKKSACRYPASPPLACAGYIV